MSNPLLDVKNLSVEFITQDGIVKAVNGISYSLNQNETLAIVGESGSGKSVSVMSLLKLIPQPPGKVTSGQAFFAGKNLLEMSDWEIRSVRGRQIGMVFQDPMTSLNPVLRISRQITEAMELHLHLSGREALDRAINMLKLVGIPGAENRVHDYPHQFSGGMRQRVMIAMALTCNPDLLIADEPTTALDVTIQAQIIKLVKGLRDNLGMAIIWITHDLGVVAGLAEKVIVMYAGSIVEMAPVDQLYTQPLHPYTRGLLGSLPQGQQRKQRGRLTSISGTPPDLLNLPPGCPFAVRCSFAMDKCLQVKPGLEILDTNHLAACWVDVNRGRER